MVNQIGRLFTVEERPERKKDELGTLLNYPTMLSNKKNLQKERTLDHCKLQREQ
jgi:hypothetical protein